MVSQYGIESIVSKFFRTGFFLEIGCWDGENISQTYALEAQGWQGICVDPFPKNFENRRCKVLSRAISSDGLPRQFIKVSTDRRNGGDVSYFSGFKDSLGLHEEVVYNHCKYEEGQVKTLKFDELPLPDFIEFLSVDTEGSELEILSSIDYKKYSFGVIMFEHNGVKETNKAIGKLLKSNGYRLYKALDLDDIFVNNKL